MSLSNTEKHVKDIRRKTRRKFSSEEKIRIVLDGLRGEYSIAELCRREGINNNLYYRWSKDFLEAGKRRLSGDTVREASTDEVVDLADKSNYEYTQEDAEKMIRALSQALQDCELRYRQGGKDEDDVFKL
jgi:transposase